MAEIGYTTFETAIGTCVIAWRSAGIMAVRLPAASRDALAADVIRRHPGALRSDPPDDVQAAIAAMQALLTGAKVDLSQIKLDLVAVPNFHARVYRATLAIMPGETKTYGALAAELGQPGAARAVGQALGANPVPIIVPCHRVLAANRRTGGFSALGGVDTKLRMLEIEGALADPAELPLQAPPPKRR